MSFRTFAAPTIGALFGLVFCAGAAMATPALTVASAKLFAGPGTDYAALTNVPSGAHVDIVWCGAHGNWCLVTDHNQRGWVLLSNLKTHVGRGTDVATTGGGSNGKGGPLTHGGKNFGGGQGGSDDGGGESLAEAINTNPHITLSPNGPSLTVIHGGGIPAASLTSSTVRPLHP